MTVTRDKLVNGIVNYANAEIINKITDKPLKIILAMIISAIKSNNSIVDHIFGNEIVSTILNEKNGEYDIDVAFKNMEQAMNEYGDFPITIPAIKYVSPSEKELTFSISDIEILKKYIIDEVR